MRITNDIQAFDAFPHSQFRFIESVSLSRRVGPEGSSGYIVELVLSQASGADEPDLRLRCIGAVDLRLGDLNGMEATLLRIWDVSSDQLEAIRFRVADQENDAFSFACESFSLEVNPTSGQGKRI